MEHLTVSFSDSEYSAPEGGSVRVRVEVSPAAYRALSIPLTIAPGEGTEEADYSHDLGASPALSFQIDDTSQEFEIRAAPDDDEVDETVLLGFGTPLPSEVSAGTPSTATVTLVEPGTNLPPNPPEGPTAVSFAENGTDSVATYRLSDPNPGDELSLRIGGRMRAHSRLPGTPCISWIRPTSRPPPTGAAAGSATTSTR